MRKEKTMTDFEVEDEIKRLLEDPDVKLFKAVERIRNRRRQFLYSLRTMKRNGVALREAGFTVDSLSALGEEEETDE